MDKVVEAQEILARAIRTYQPGRVFGLFSGGHDSLCSTSLAAMHPKFSGAVNINTTIGIQETRNYVRDVCAAKGWQLSTYLPPTSYKDICVEHGMPGPGAHQYCYIRLKERCIQQLVRERKTYRHDRIVLVTGVRRSESVRRMGHVEEIQRSGAQVWVAPIINWTDEDKETWMASQDLPRNPVVDELGMSGECLCGAFAKPEELGLIAEAFPKTAAQIRDIEDACAQAGVHATWGVRPPKKAPKMRLCYSCEAKGSRLPADTEQGKGS